MSKTDSFSACLFRKNINRNCQYNRPHASFKNWAITNTPKVQYYLFLQAVYYMISTNSNFGIYNASKELPAANI